MIKVYGSSDDLIEIDGDIYEEFNPSYGEHWTFLGFSDGSVIKIRFDEDGIWRILPVVRAPGTSISIEHAIDDNGTDTATLEGPISWVLMGTHCHQDPQPHVCPHASIVTQQPNDRSVQSQSSALVSRS